MIDNDVFIYLLKDPFTMQVIYVGQSINPKQRLRSHITEAKHHKRKINKLVLDILEAGSRPVMEILEKCDQDNWKEREQYWIKYYFESGNDLGNIGRGGGDARPLNFESMRGFSLFIRTDQYNILEQASTAKESIAEHIRRAIDLYIEENYGESIQDEMLRKFAERKGTDAENSQPDPKTKK